MASYAADRHRAYLERSLGAHAAYTLHYHLVWSVKARRPLLQPDVASSLRDHLLGTSEATAIHILALHVEPEHVHMLISLAPSTAVSAAVQRLKGASARYLRQAFPHLVAIQGETLWNTGYFARTLGDLNVAQAKAYLDGQQAHHTSRCGKDGAD